MLFTEEPSDHENADDGHNSTVALSDVDDSVSILAGKVRKEARDAAGQSKASNSSTDAGKAQKSKKGEFITFNSQRFSERYLIECPLYTYSVILSFLTNRCLFAES